MAEEEDAVVALLKDEKFVRFWAVKHFGDLRSDQAKEAGCVLLQPYINSLISVFEHFAQVHKEREGQ